MNYAYNEAKMLDGISQYRKEVRANPQATTQIQIIRGDDTTGREVVRQVAERYKLPVSSVTGTSHERYLVIAREVIVLILRKAHDYSYQHTGRILNRHHTTMIHAEKKGLERYRADAKFMELVDSLIGRNMTIERDSLGLPVDNPRTEITVEAI